jgi:hypothetical protein
MLIEAEVITYCNHWPITENLGIRREHHLQASAEIQVFIARSTNKCMSPYRILTSTTIHPSRVRAEASPSISGLSFSCWGVL